MTASDQPREQGADKRKTARETVMFIGTISCANASYPVKLRNLSAEGAMFVGDVVSYAGAWLTLRRNDTLIRGRMAWASDGSGGMKFDAPLDVSRLLRRLPPRRLGYQPRFRRPTLSGRD